MNALHKLTEIEKLRFSTSINIMYMGDIHQFALDENMQMKTSISSQFDNKEYIRALLLDALDDLNRHIGN